METTLAQLAEFVGGQVVGDSTTPIRNAATLQDAGCGDITLIDTAERAARLSAISASAAVAPRGVGPLPLPLIVVDDVHQAFTQLVAHFHPPRKRERIGISPHAVVSDSAILSDGVDVHPQATIGDDVEIGPGSVIHSGVHLMAGCKIGAGVTIMPGAVLYEDTRVGDRTLIHAGAVIGAYGFGYDLIDGRHALGAQLGHVEIGADVEVGANATIDRGTYGPTTIGEGTKIDNLVMIAHNCRIGRHNMICSQVGIAGSTSTGDYVVMAGQVGVRDHVHVGTGAVLGAKAGVSNDVRDGSRVFGIPAVPEREQKLKFAAIAKLPEMRKEFRELKRVVQQMQDQHQDGPSSAVA